MTLKEIFSEQFDPNTAMVAEPIIKKYYDRAVQDKSPDSQALLSVLKELQASKVQQPQQGVAK
jgi:uncharacterized protein YqcC (DUF446 family)